MVTVEHLQADCSEEDHYAEMEKVRNSYRKAEEYADYAGPESNVSLGPEIPYISKSPASRDIARPACNHHV